MSVIISTIAVLLCTALVGALLIYFVSKHFSVETNPKVESIVSLLPGANCGGCGFKGCRDFAENCAKATSLTGIFCPVGGAELMGKVATITGLAAAESVETPVAVVKCSGSCALRPDVAQYDGVDSCSILAAVAAGDRPCSYGCLGRGDCVAVCVFGALVINHETGLPEVDVQKCVACGKCVAACPRHLIELMPRGRRDRRVWVACSNRDRGAVARKLCQAACIGCGKCSRECPFGAITLTDNLAQVDSSLCRACGKCVAVCPTGAMLSTFKTVSHEA